ncbi:MAG: leucine-rich repeat domain-containing protein [Clostridia bacterium]|nr:leucine-rich repeat domain-containing protein [Clostridia bacterium]
MKKALLCCALLITALALAGCGIFGGDYAYRRLPDGTAEITKYRGKAETLEVPGELGGKTVTGIGSYAFSDCVRLRSVTLPDSVTGIGDSAFLFCRELTSVTFPEGLKQIGEGAFSNCQSLTSVTLHYGVTDIGEGAFYRCTALTQVTLPESVARIGKNAFSFPQVGGGSFTAPIEGLVVTVGQDSYAEEYCRTNGIPFRYGAGD